MLRACSYCGFVHDEHYVCDNKRKALKKRQTRQRKVRSASRWTTVRNRVLHRDKAMCQCCLAEEIGTKRKYNGDFLEVHHITPIEEDESRSYDEDNLLTVCRYHHELCESGKISRKRQYELVEKAKNLTDDSINAIM